MVAAIMLREFIVTSLRVFCLNKGVVLEAKTLGKHKTVSQIAGAIIIFLTLILKKKFFASSTVLFMHDQLIPLVMWYIVIITVFSGMHYLWVNRKLIKTF
jgi:phosphatidylglycerophosphate synthase